MLLLMPVPSSTELPGPEVSAVTEGLGEAAWRAILALIDGVRDATLIGLGGVAPFGQAKIRPRFPHLRSGGHRLEVWTSARLQKVSPATSYPRR